MSHYLHEYSEQTNIPILTGITALSLDFEEVVILEFGQGLWFGNHMDKSLINPNKWKNWNTNM